VLTATARQQNVTTLLTAAAVATINELELNSQMLSCSVLRCAAPRHRFICLNLILRNDYLFIQFHTAITLLIVV
jgi:hypothetical protein